MRDHRFAIEGYLIENGEVRTVRLEEREEFLPLRIVWTIWAYINPDKIEYILEVFARTTPYQEESSDKDIFAKNLIQFRHELLKNSKLAPSGANAINIDNNLNLLSYPDRDHDQNVKIICECIKQYFIKRPQDQLCIDYLFYSSIIELGTLREILAELRGLNIIDYYGNEKDWYVSPLGWLESMDRLLDAKTDGGGAVANNLSNDNKKVFIVHGHDDGKKDTVARFIQNQGLEPIILHEQASKGMTIAEMIEEHSDVQFAIVILTPDDEGKSVKDRSNKKRARQNVILELGYFWGKLGRSNVRALYVEGVELPSDYKGIIYIPFDKEGAWKQKVVKELKVVWSDLEFKI